MKSKWLRVVGIAALTRRLNRLRATIDSASASEAARLSGDVANRAAQLAPKASGAMAASIEARPPKRTEDGWEAEVVVGEHYGFWVEMGTEDQPPQPFLRPAADEVSQRGLPDSAKRIGRTLEREW